MKTISQFCLVLISISLCAPDALSQGNTQRGAVLGGVTGATVGAIIGDHNNETAAGAVIGGALGLLAGSALGNSADQQLHYERAAAAERRYQAQSRTISARDVVAMSRNHLSDDVIISSINVNGVDRTLEVSDIIALHQQGVSEVVIRAMQRAPVGGAVPAPTYRVAQPVVVEHHRHVVPAYIHGFPPPYYYRHYGHHYGHGHRRGKGVGWSISVGGH